MKKVLIKILNLFSKNKVVLLIDFHNEVGKIAKKYNENYFTSGIDVRTNSSNQVVYKYTAYINNFNHSTGKTPKEAVDGLKAQKSNEGIKEFTVII